MANVVAVCALVAAGICLTLGVLSFAVNTRQRGTNGTVPASRQGIPPPVEDQSAVSESIESVSKLASALKDLDRLAQLFILALGFLVVAAVAAGLNEIARALK